MARHNICVLDDEGITGTDDNRWFTVPFTGASGSVSLTRYIHRWLNSPLPKYSDRLIKSDEQGLRLLIVSNLGRVNFIVQERFRRAALDPS